MAAFNASAILIGNKMVTNFDTSLRHVTNHVFLGQALQIQKQYMHRMMIKPCTTIRKYVVRLAEINGYLVDFPLHKANQAIPMDELLEISEFSILVSWKHQVTRHRIDPSQQNSTICGVL